MPRRRGRRGWRNFFVVDALGAEVTITVGDVEHVTTVDRSGYVDARIPNPGLEPGWAEVTLRTPESADAVAPILVVDPAQSLGVVSDIDDTVLRTFLPRPLVAAYNTFVLDEQSRTPVRGMSTFYSRLLIEHGSAPVFYLSTGAWNNAGTLTRFLATHGFPAGPLLLTDWGPTHTGWFRSGAEHKRVTLRQLAQDFPHLKWVLIGDNGQRDPSLYGEFAREHPDKVAGVAIRNLPMTEQVLAHGTTGERSGQDEHNDFTVPPGVFWVDGDDGDELSEAWWGSREPRGRA